MEGLMQKYYEHCILPEERPVGYRLKLTINGAAPPSRARKRPHPSHGLREVSAEAANTLRRVEEIGTALRPPAGGAPARERLDLLARRVRARLIPN